MKLLRSQMDPKTGAGTATLLPEEPEDMVRALSSPPLPSKPIQNKQLMFMSLY